MIKKALKNGDTHLPKLIFDAIGDIANTLTGEKEKNKILETLEFYIAMEKGRLSYKNIWVYEVENESAGLIIAYSSNDAKELDEPIIEHLSTKGISVKAFDKESLFDEFYIDTVSVRPPFQRRGIAKALFAFIEQETKKLGFEKVSLLVDLENLQALELYEKMGFEKKGVLKVSNSDFWRMIKEI